MTGKAIATIRNKQGEVLGDAPDISFDECDYFSYYENDYGQQSIFVYDGAEGRLYVGNGGWEDPRVIPKADIEAIDKSTPITSVAPALTISGLDWPRSYLVAVSSQTSSRESFSERRRQHD